LQLYGIVSFIPWIHHFLFFHIQVSVTRVRPPTSAMQNNAIVGNKMYDRLETKVQISRSEHLCMPFEFLYQDVKTV